MTDEQWLRLQLKNVQAGRRQRLADGLGTRIGRLLQVLRRHPA
jgi:hypothetical protein